MSGAIPAQEKGGWRAKQTLNRGSKKMFLLKQNKQTRKGNSATYPIHFQLLKKKSTSTVPGWFHWLNVGLLISIQVMILGSQD